MPIDLSKQQQELETTVKVCSPMFFTSKIPLTGRGGKAGLLNEMRNPSQTPFSVRTDKADVDPLRRSITSSQTDYHFVPLFAMTSNTLSLIETMPNLDPNHSCQFASDAYGQSKVWLHTTLHSLTITRDKPYFDKVNGKRVTPPANLRPIYRLDLAIITDPSNPTMKNLRCCQSNPNAASLMRSHENAYIQIFTANIPRRMSTISEALKNTGAIVNDQVLNDYIDKLSLYDLACERSDVWQNSIDQEIEPLLELVAQHLNERIYNFALTDTIRRLETYGVALDIYRNIFTSLKNLYPPKVVSAIARENLNIMLSDLMEQINNDKGQLPVFNGNPIVKNKPGHPNYSPEQLKAIQAPGPLMLVQAVAGSGKSSVILGRIAHMLDSGIDPANICVISFTNAAADHIREEVGDDDVKSMTIDSLVTQIYQYNYPDQNISTPFTMMNGLDVYFPRDPDARALREHLRHVANSVEGSYTSLNRFVENNLDKVKEILATIGQITFDLAIIMCYNLIDELQQPDELAAKHLIIDEVQDTSIFQFIYALRYVQKHKMSLMFVGDSSQTLYEFRFANPRALNVMESSGVFDAYKLQTNYRSRQEILEMANQTLKNIEANQYAHLSLHSNDLTPVTTQSFKDHVRLNYTCVDTLSSFIDNMATYANHIVRPYIDECIARGEQVTVLAYQHAEVDAMEQALRSFYPNLTIENVSPKHGYETTVLTSFVKLFWDNVPFMRRDNLIGNIENMCYTHIADLIRNKNARDPSLRFLSEWSRAAKAWYKPKYDSYVDGDISEKELFDELQKQMFSYEAEYNLEQQSRLSRANANARDKKNTANTNIILSTIHSAKGLEYDNVVLIYRDKQPMDETEKRLYYVGLTRACKSEFIMAYERSKKTPAIQDAYDNCLASFHNSTTSPQNP